MADSEPRFSKDEEIRMFCVQMAVQTERYSFRTLQQVAEKRGEAPMEISDWVISEAEKLYAYVTQGPRLVERDG